MVSIEEFPIASSDHIPGYKIVEEKGFVYGLTVRARGIGGDIGAGAKELGANAIITMRMDSDSISQNMQEVLAYGTAVVIEKEE